MNRDDYNMRKTVKLLVHGDYLIALCIDHTMWRLVGGVWKKLPDIPKD